MRIWFDESYDQPAKRYLLLGALFTPTRELVRRFESTKDSYRKLAPGRSFDEVKYSTSSDTWRSQGAISAIDEFMRTDSYFRCVVIDTQEPTFSWDHYGRVGMPSKLKRAFGYNKFAERLLYFNTRDIKEAVLFTDRLQ